MNPRNTPTPTTDTNALIMALVVLNGDAGVATVALLQGMYPTACSMTN